MAKKARNTSFERRKTTLLQLAQIAVGIKHAEAWLSAKQPGLGGRIPLEYAITKQGYQEVRDLLLRIEHGVF